MDAERIYFVDVTISAVPLSVPQLSHETPTGYPSTYLAENPGKPQISIYTCNPNQAYHYLAEMINELQWSDVIVATYMAKIIEENPQVFSITATEAWTSCQRDIAQLNHEVTPLDILAINLLDPRENTPAPNLLTPSTARERLSRLYALLLLYRKTISKGIDDNYGAELARKMNNHFQARGLEMSEADSAALNGYIGADRMTISYKRIIAAIDMFFFKYPDSPYAQIRMATLPTRYRGCETLSALGQIAKLCGMTPAELTSCILTKPVARDVVRITKSGEGAGDIYGYFPYHVELGLVTKSSYSMGANPTLCYWLHTIGVVQGYTRSSNARLADTMDQTGTFESAAAIGLSLGHLSEALDREQDGAPAAPAEGGYEPVDPGATPLERRVDEVLNDLRENSGLSDRQRATLRAAATKYRTWPQTTMGAHFYNLYGAA